MLKCKFKNDTFQSEMQTLRNRLTVAETKLLEREVEIRNFQEENKTLKDAVENIAEKSSVSSQQSCNQHLITNGSKFMFFVSLLLPQIYVHLLQVNLTFLEMTTYLKNGHSSTYHKLYHCN